MKILEINSVCGIRSTGRICTDIMQVAEENGMECRVAYGREYVPEQYADRAVRVSGRADVFCHAAAARLFDTAGFCSSASTKKFLRWVDEYSPDIVHLHNLHGYYINIRELFVYLKERGIPVVITLHDCWMFTGHCAHFDYVGCERWKNEGCYACPQRGEYPRSLYYDGSRRNFRIKRELFTSLDNAVVITPSEWLASLAKSSFLGKYPVKVINNGIDLEVFREVKGDLRSRYGLEGKRIALGVASAWNKRKGFDDFLRLSEMLPSEWQIVLIGLTDKHMKMLPENVLGISSTNNATELAEWYSTADVFLNLTYEDTFPTVNLEAMACGTPVITYRTGGSPESITEETGAVTCERSPEAVVKIIDSVKKDSIACRKNAEKYDKWQQFGKYIDEYRLIKENN